MSDIPQNLVDKMMVKCARRCCICRRFRPTKLQVHHIIERGQGGTDDEHNLIVVCFSCHSDVHTKVPFARRFSVEELKGHRDALVKMVEEGKLPADDTDDTDEVMRAILQQLRGSPKAEVALLPEAVKILLSAAQSKDGVVFILRTGPRLHLQVEGRSLLNTGDAREEAKFKRALEQLLSTGLLDYVSDSLLTVTYDGYLAADEIAVASSDGGHK